MLLGAAQISTSFRFLSQFTSSLFIFFQHPIISRLRLFWGGGVVFFLGGGSPVGRGGGGGGRVGLTVTPSASCISSSLWKGRGAGATSSHFGNIKATWELCQSADDKTIKRPVTVAPPS